jgi:hypothetical protein
MTNYLAPAREECDVAMQQKQYEISAQAPPTTTDLKAQLAALQEQMRKLQERVAARDAEGVTSEGVMQGVGPQKELCNTSYREKSDPSLCGAKTRAGHPCERKGSGKGGRCRSHGGKSTGARTEEGLERIAEAQRRRWEAWRAEHRA